jgi:hypothetical protein
MAKACGYERNPADKKLLQVSDQFWADEHETFMDQSALDTKEPMEFVKKVKNEVGDV